MSNTSIHIPTEYEVAVYEDHFLRSFDRYVPAIKQWYEKYKTHIFPSVGSFPVKGAPDGLMLRFCLSGHHSVVKGIQGYLFIPCGYFGLPPARGGVRTILNYVFHQESEMSYQGLRLYLRTALQGTNHSGMFVAVITEEMRQQIPVGRFIWVGAEDTPLLRRGIVSQKFRNKIVHLERGVTSFDEINMEDDPYEDDGLDKAFGL